MMRSRDCTGAGPRLAIAITRVQAALECRPATRMWFRKAVAKVVHDPDVPLSFLRLPAQARQWPDLYCAG